MAPLLRNRMCFNSVREKHGSILIAAGFLSFFTHAKLIHAEALIYAEAFLLNIQKEKHCLKTLLLLS